MREPCPTTSIVSRPESGYYRLVPLTCFTPVNAAQLSYTDVHAYDSATAWKLLLVLESLYGPSQVPACEIVASTCVVARASDGSPSTYYRATAQGIEVAQDVRAGWTEEVVVVCSDTRANVLTSATLKVS